MKTNFIAILVTCGSKREAEKIVNSLLKRRLIACANIVSGIESRFWWKGKIDKAKEILIILKAQQKNFKRIEKEIKHIHSYEVPEIIALPIVSGNKAYLDWLEAETC
ncbi:MAG: divalent-cation tolerance protein CutA [Candidatus Omnitrophica bacterium]|nr:divalent-cation tolerance protein CutA [Candidatus Omnitrophota bacterium]